LFRLFTVAVRPLDVHSGHEGQKELSNLPNEFIQMYARSTLPPSRVAVVVGIGVEEFFVILRKASKGVK